MKKAPFVYWFQSHNAAGPLPEGFRDLVKNNFTSIPQSRGPVESRKGLLITAYQVDGFIYDGESYKWREIAPNVWLGYLLDFSPADFLDQKTTGYVIKLADGNPWLIPVCNPNSENYSIPTTDHLSLDEDGNRRWLPETIDKYDELTYWMLEIHDGVIESMLEEKNYEFDFSDDHCMKMFCLAISVNYNLGDHELSALGLFDTDSYMNMVLAMLDNDVIQKCFVKETQYKLRQILAG